MRFSKRRLKAYKKKYEKSKDKAILDPLCINRWSPSLIIQVCVDRIGLCDHSGGMLVIVFIDHGVVCIDY